MSRYPSAHGHTPSYKSLGSGAGSSYPSALGSSVLDSGSSLGRDMDREMAAIKREMDRDFGTAVRDNNMVFYCLTSTRRVYTSVKPSNIMTGRSSH